MDSNKLEVIQTLCDMGFTETQINNAILSTGSQDIQVLITFLENQQNDNGQTASNVQGSLSTEGQSIGGIVNQEFVALLMSLGHSKNVSEKALLFTENKTVEDAEKWIFEHSKDQDFEEELKIVQSQTNKISSADAAIQAKEIMRKARDKRIQQEQQDELERERNRIKSQKAMGDVKRELDEIKRRQDAEYLKKERMQNQVDKDKILQQLQRDKEARFGKKFAQENTGGVIEKQPQQFTTIQSFEVGIKQIKVAQPPDLLPEVAKGSLTLISKILENIIKNPTEPKFRKISLNSQVYTTKILEVFGARNALDSVGFVEEDGFYQYKGNDLKLLGDSLSLVHKELMGL